MRTNVSVRGSRQLLCSLSKLLRVRQATCRTWDCSRAALPCSGTRHVSAKAVANVDAAEVVSIRAAPTRKYVMVSGKGGVGKTSLSASLAIKYAAEGHDTLIVSTDPAHSLGDSLGQRLPGGVPVQIEGTSLPIWGMEIDPDKATEKFKAFAATGGKEKVKVVLTVNP